MTTPSNPIRTLNCPTCGAPLEINVDEPTIHCQYCGATVENPEYQRPQHIPQPAPQAQVFQVEYPTTRELPKKQRSPLACFLIVALVVLAIGGGGYLLLSAISGAGLGNGLSLGPIFLPQVYPPAVLLSADTSATPNLIAVTYDAGSEKKSISRLDMASHKVLWNAMTQKDSLSIDLVVAGDTLVYVVSEDRLVALQLSDGKQAWSASLPDKLPGICPSCVQLEKGQVIVLTTDGSLGAYDALTGHQTWEKHFDYTGSMLYPLPEGVALTYNVAQGSAVGIIDATSGTEVTHIEPTCEGNSETDEMENYSDLIFDTSGPSPKVYILYGLFNACVQRWDLTSGTLDWHYVESDQNLDNSRDTPALLANGALYYVQDDQLRSLDAATGTQTKTLDQPKDYSLAPLLVSGKRLLVRATRTQGSTRYELWGYDLDSGQNLWKRPMLNSTPMDPPDGMSGLIDTDGTAWTYQMTPGGLWLITFQAQPNQVNLAQVNLDTGELSSQQSLPLTGLGPGTDFYSVPERIASRDQTAWFAVETGVYALDPQAGKFTYQWH